MLCIPVKTFLNCVNEAFIKSFKFETSLNHLQKVCFYMRIIPINYADNLVMFEMGLVI